MSVTAWSLVRFVHVLSATVWVGGQIVLSLVVLPAVRTTLGPEERGPVVHLAAKRFALVANAVVLPLALASGLAMLWHRGVDFDMLGLPGYGRLLSIKLSLVVLSVGLAAAHGILATRDPRRARPLAIGGLAAAVGVVVFATALVP